MHQGGSIAQDINAGAARKAGPWDQLSRYGVIRMGKRNHLVPPTAQLTREQIDDALDAAIELGGTSSSGSAVMALQIRRCPQSFRNLMAAIQPTSRRS